MYKFKIENMHCMSCVRNIEDTLKEVDASIKLTPEFDKHLLNIESKLLPDEISKLIESAGYKNSIVK